MYVYPLIAKKSHSCFIIVYILFSINLAALFFRFVYGDTLVLIEINEVKITYSVRCQVSWSLRQKFTLLPRNITMCVGKYEYQGIFEFLFFLTWEHSSVISLALWVG